jgi:hypothetical protein
MGFFHRPFFVNQNRRRKLASAQAGAVLAIKLIALIRSQSIFSSAKILGDFFLRSASGEENFQTRPEASGLKQENFLLRLPLKISTNFDSEKTDCARIMRVNLKPPAAASGFKIIFSVWSLGWI